MAEAGSNRLAERLADYAVAERTAVLPADVLHQARRAVMDWYAAAHIGRGMEPSVAAERAFADECDCGAARLVSGRRATIRAAAFLNGVAAHAAEVDDIFRDAVFHPGSPAIAAALAVGGARGCSGALLLRAVVVAYEISTRIASAVFDGHYRFWHPTGTIGAIGATAAAATMLRLDAPRFVQALSTALSLTAGLQQAFRAASMTKPLHAGHAAETGAASVLLAESGVTGGIGMLDGPGGFGAAMARDANGAGPDWRIAEAGLGRDYNIRRITIKNHCCCGQAFVPIDGALHLRAAHGIRPEAIRAVRIATYEAALRVAGGSDTGTAEAARFSIPYTVAHALSHGSVRIAAFEPAARAEAAVLDLMHRTTLTVDPAYTARFPATRCARVEIELADGLVLAREQTSCKGTPEDPLSDAELAAKFRELAAPALGATAAEALLDRLWHIDDLDSIADLHSARDPIRAIT